MLKRAMHSNTRITGLLDVALKGRFRVAAGVTRKKNLTATSRKGYA
jgi:hypothetical protein